MTLAAWGLVVIATLPGLFRLQVETSASSILDRTDSEWAAYQRSIEIFGGDEFVTILIDRDPDGELCNRRVRELTRELQSVRGVDRVDSVCTVSGIGVSELGEPNGQRGQTIPGIDNHGPDWNHPFIAESLVSQDREKFAVNVFLEHDWEESSPTVIAEIREVGTGAAAITGVPVFRAVADERMRRELWVMGPLAMAMLTVLIFIVFGSWQAAIVPLVTNIVGSLVPFSLMGLAGVPITITTVILPAVYVALGSAYCIHVLCRVTERELAAGSNRASECALSIMISGLTTAMGFLAISVVEIPAVRQVGAFGALGALVLAVGSISLAPALAGLIGVPVRRQRLANGILRMNRSVVSVVQSRSPVVFLSWLLFSGVAIVGACSVQVSTNVVAWFAPGDAVRVDYEMTKANTSGISVMNVVVSAPRGGSMLTPEGLDAVGSLGEHVRSIPGVAKVVSLVDVMAPVYMSMAGAEARVSALPVTVEQIEQLMLILGSTDEIRTLVAIDGEHLNMPMRLDVDGSSELLSIAASVEGWVRENAADVFEADVTGIMYEFARAEDRISYGQIFGLLLAASAIGIILALAFGRWDVAMVAMIPNALPILGVFGGLGLIGVPLDASTVLIGTLALGIAVDDSVHLVVEFLRGRASGSDPASAIRSGIDCVGRPLLITTVVVAVGFLALCTSGFTPIVFLGGLVSATAVICWLADLTLLPALLERVSRGAQLGL